MMEINTFVQNPLERRAGVLAALILFLPLGLHAGLDPNKSITQYRHDVWRVEQGLPQNTVAAVVQTPDGYLWCGTELGVVRFDGRYFKVFDKSNTPELYSNAISALHADRHGRLWIGTAGGGLTQLDHGRFRTYTMKDGLANDYVLSIVEDPRGAVWIGTNGGGLSRLDNGRFTTFTTKEGLPSNAVFAIAADRQGTIWIGTNAGLSSFRDGKIGNFLGKTAIADKYVRSIYADPDGSIWIGTNESGLVRFNDGQFKTFSRKQGLSSDAIASILRDDSGNLWVGTIGGGLCRWSAGKFTAFPAGRDLAKDDVWALYFDRGGNLWIGAGSGGLNRLMDGRFTAYNTEEGLSHDVVLPIFEDHAGRIWMGTNGGGVNRLENGRISAITAKDGLADDLVFTIAEDREGSMWFGTRAGLNRYKSGKFTRYTSKNGLPSDIALVTFADSKGALWIGTRRGLSVFRNGAFTNFTTADGLSSDCVQAIEEDRAGALWLGTCGGGVNRLQNGKFEVFNRKQGLGNDVVMSLYTAANGDVWVGTNGGGLSRLRAGKFTTYTTREGLPDDAIFRILDDAAGNLWMTSNKGVFRCSIEELSRVAEGKLARVSPVTYDRSDGMKSRECNGGYQPAGWKAHNGTLWFPTMSGAVAVDPNDQRPLESAPAVLIERASINNREADPEKVLQAPPGRGELEFRYTAISFQFPEKTKFRYKLEGFDRDWVEAGERREAYYTNLPSGTYLFRVTAAGRDGASNHAGASMELTLLPHWWETWWFRTLAISAVIGSIVIAFWWKDQIATAQRRRLEAMVEQRTTELREQVRREERARAELSEAQQRLLELSRLCGMAEVATGVLHNVGNVLNSVNVCTTIVAEKIGEFRVNNLAAVIQMLQQHSGDLETFLREDERGRRLIPYLAKLAGSFQEDRDTAISELKQLRDHIDHIKAIVATQQKYAKVSGLIEELSLAGLVDDALRVVGPEFQIHEISVNRDFEDLPAIAADRHKIMQILLNLFRNATDAIVHNGGGTTRRILVSIRRRQGNRVRIEVKDSGVGLEQQELARIFALGFTTKAHGHGFGLHSGALAAKQMSGSLWAESDGPGLGSTFVLEIPANAVPERNAA